MKTGQIYLSILRENRMNQRLIHWLANLMKTGRSLARVPARLNRLAEWLGGILTHNYVAVNYIYMYEPVEFDLVLTVVHSR